MVSFLAFAPCHFRHPYCHPSIHLVIHLFSSLFFHPLRCSRVPYRYSRAGGNPEIKNIRYKIFIFTYFFIEKKNDKKS